MPHGKQGGTGESGAWGPGQGEEAAAVIVEVAASYPGELRSDPHYDTVDPTAEDSPNGKVVWEAGEAVQRIGGATVPVLLNRLDQPGSRLFCERMLTKL